MASNHSHTHLDHLHLVPKRREATLVNQTLRLRFPGWFDATMPSSSRQGSDAFGSNSETINYDYDEFLLSTGWVLRPKGLQELFEELEKSVVVRHYESSTIIFTENYFTDKLTSVET